MMTLGWCGCGLYTKYSSREAEGSAMQPQVNTAGQEYQYEILRRRVATGGHDNAYQNHLSKCTVNDYTLPRPPTSVKVSHDALLVETPSTRLSSAELYRSSSMCSLTCATPVRVG